MNRFRHAEVSGLGSAAWLVSLQRPWLFLITLASESQDGCCTSSNQVQMHNKMKNKGRKAFPSQCFYWLSGNDGSPQRHTPKWLAQNYIPRLSQTMKLENQLLGFPDSICLLSWNVGELTLALSDDLEGQDKGKEGGLRRRGYIYNYDWFELLYGRNQHNIVKIKKQKMNSLISLLPFLPPFF